MQKTITTVLISICLYLSYEVFSLKQEMRATQRNAAIAVLSAEAANNQIGAIAPYFNRNDAAFAKAWVDTTGMPLAVFPDDILNELRQELQKNRELPEVKQLSKKTFGLPN